MIFHNCIKCGYFELIEYRAGMFQRYICPECKEEQYIRHSNFDPTTYSKDQVEIDEIKKTIKLK